MNNDHIKTW